MAYKGKSYGEDDEYRARMKKSRLAFSEVKPTSEYSETNYYNQTPGQDMMPRFVINSFWHDYAEHIASRSRGPFLTPNFHKTC